MPFHQSRTKRHVYLACSRLSMGGEGKQAGDVRGLVKKKVPH